jgi:hypothetical protein
MTWSSYDDEEDEPTPELTGDAARAVARSFYVLRMARYVALIVVLAGVAALATAGRAPAAVSIVLAAVAAAFVVVAVVTALRWRRGPSSSR